MVKNEEPSLPACLASLAGVADDVVVVDTGSSDRTRDVARQHGARVFDFPWCDDFSAARNECLRHAHGDWVLWLDADERFDDANRERLRALRSTLGDDPAAYVFTQRSAATASTSTLRVQQVRLFRRHADVRWEYVSVR
jgi:glycosyltransferase involved in cell wall biosynthesis